MKYQLPTVFKFLRKPDPQGMVLAGEEAEQTIEKWQKEVRSIERDQDRIEDVVPEMKDRLVEIDEHIKGCSVELKEAKARFAEVKTPVAKRRWARRVVYNHRTLAYLRDSKQLMALNIERAQSSLEDATVIARLLAEKIRDAELYYKLNGQIRLIGNALASAEYIHDRSKSIEKDVELSVEGLEKLVESMDDTKMLQEAERIVG